MVSSGHADDTELIDADRPGIADGSHTLTHGRFQIETGFDQEHTAGERSLSVPTLLRYGVSDSLELRAESDSYEHTRRSSGWNPISIGLKDHFYERDSASLGVIARWFFPSGSGAFRSDSNSGDVRLAADLEFGERWAVNPNIGIEKPGGGVGAVTVQYNLSKTANVFVDSGVQRSEVLVDGGAAWVVGVNTQLDVSIGWGAHGANAPNVFWSAGLSRRF